jgi:hypothetical protein
MIYNKFMFLHKKIVDGIDSLGRKCKRRSYVCKCDVCDIEFEKNSSLVKRNKIHVCSKICNSEARKNDGIIGKQRIKTNVEKYGVGHALQSEICMEKLKRTNVEKYGVEYATSSCEIKERVKNTFLERYGVENPNQCVLIKEKIRTTCLEKYGVENPLQSTQIREQIKKTCIEKYGVDNISKTQWFADLPYKNKCSKTGYENFRGRNIWYRSSYEQRFIAWCDNNIDVLDIAPNVKTTYTIEGVEHYYFIDFGVTFLSGEKILYEIKASQFSDTTINQIKFEVARCNCKRLGYDKFEVITENELDCKYLCV